jgi:hypothetical protein
MKQALLWCIVAAAMLLSGCGSVRVRQLVQNPARYENRDVKVEGRVTRSVGVIVAGAYTVDDGTGKITVLSNRAVPPPGADVRVKGTFQSGVSLLGRSFGATIRERDVDVRSR